MFDTLKTQILSLKSQSKEALAASLETFSQGGIILFPTESVYGLAVDSRSPSGIEQLYELKGRPKEKPFQWLVSDMLMIRSQSTIWNEDIEKLATTFWPGPLTLVLPSIDGATVGWRIPKHDWLLGLLKVLGHPLIATSANLSGQPALKEFKAALQPFQDHINLALDGGAIESGIPSTVVKWQPEGFKILREGTISQKNLDQVLRGARTKGD